MSSKRPWRTLPLFLGLCFAAAAAGASFGPGEWYAGLTKPAWNPPDSVFPIVWTPLYAMIAWAGWLLQSNSGWRSAALRAWFVQLAGNAAWTPLFFGLQRPDLALLDIVALVIAVAVTIRLAWCESRTAAWLLAPYLAWVSFATALNGALWWLNQ